MDRRKFLAATIGLGTGLAAGPLLAAAGASVLARENDPRAALPPDPKSGKPYKARIFITGSAEGLGHAAAATLLAEGYEVVVHVRSQARLPAVQHLVDQGAIATIADLSDLAQVQELAGQVNDIGRMDAVIHNAGVFSGNQILTVNVVAPYLLTALMTRPERLIYLSSSMHAGGRTELAEMDWAGQRASGSYSDSKLFVTTLAMAIARRWPEVLTNAVDPGWVPTRMGGPTAPDDLRLGHLTQEWLASSSDPRAMTSGGYWYHQQRREPHSAVNDIEFQDRLLEALVQATGVQVG